MSNPTPAPAPEPSAPSKSSSSATPTPRTGTAPAAPASRRKVQLHGGGYVWYDDHDHSITLPDGTRLKGAHLDGNHVLLPLKSAPGLDYTSRNELVFKNGKATIVSTGMSGGKPHTVESTGPVAKIPSRFDSGAGSQAGSVAPVTYAGQTPATLGPKAPKAAPSKPKAAPAASTHAGATPDAAGQAIAGGGNTHDFAVDVLKGIGAPVTQSNIQAIMAWSTAESRPGQGAAFNPMNTTQGAAGATNFNSVGVKNFGSYQDGVKATVQTLLNGRYGPILAAFHKGNDPFAVAKAVAASPWGTGQGVLNVLNGGHVAAQPIAGATGSGGYGPPVGGATGSGSTPGATTGSAAVPKDQPLDMGDLAAQYGFATAYLNGIPEIKGLFQKAFSDPKGQWTADKFAAKLKNTTYYKTHSAAQAAWDEQNLTQHPIAVRRVQILQADLQRQATAMGATISPFDLHKLAVTLLSTGQDGDPTFIKNALAAHVTYDAHASQGLKGDAGDMQRQLRQLYSDYGLPVDEDRIGRATVAILQGKTNLDDFTEQIKTLAKSLYPTLASAIDQGTTVRDYASPYKSLMSQLLEIPDTSIDVTKDPTIRKALAMPDPKTGQPTVQPLWQFEQTLRSDPRWLKTDGARNGLMDTGIGVLQDMGLSA